MQFLEKNSRSQRVWYIVFAFALGILYDVFFWDKELGLGFLIFIGLYLAGFLAITQAAGRLTNKHALWLLIPILVLSVDVVLYNNFFVQNLVPWAVLILTVGFSFLVTLQNPERLPFFLRCMAIVRQATLPLKKLENICQDLTQFRGAQPSDRYKKIALGVLVALPLLIVFGLLFSQADAVFSSWATKLFNFKFNQPELLWRIVRTTALTLFIGEIFYVLWSDEHKLSAIVGMIKKIDTTIVATVLVLVNTLFLVFVFIQIKYLFGSANFVVTNGLSFAAYARSGFFELAWVMVIVAGLLGFIYRSLSPYGSSKIVTALKLLLIVQVLAIAVSALKRMNLYQAEYGFTTLRLYVEWFIYFSMLCFTGLAVAMLQSVPYKQFFYATLIGGIIALTAVSSVNVDRYIARSNIYRYTNEGKKIDMVYLKSLSLDAAPEIIQVYQLGLDPQRVSQDVDTLNSFLLRRQASILKAYDSWTEFNFGAQRAQQSINNALNPS